ncbi:MAG TPA: AAA family ATPase [Terracidiphilus sp.]|nr:AAA family ATPase [Terracidiphilus sp.]
MSEKAYLPVEDHAEAHHTRAIPSQYMPMPLAQDFEPETPGVPLSHYLWILRRHLWKMLAFVAVCVLVTFIVSARIKPIYESTATIDIDLHAPTGIVGQDSTTPMTSENPDIFLATQIRLIQSDAVLRPVAEQFHLAGRGGRSKGQSPSDAQAASQGPVSLAGLSVTRPADTYLLLISDRSQDPNQAAEVANAVATSYLARTYDLRIRSSTGLSSFMSSQLDDLKAKMEKSSLALTQFEKNMDVINPEQKTDILSARLLQLNTEYTTAQVDRVSKEAAWNAVKSGSVEAAAVSSQGASLAKLNDALIQAQEHLAAVKAVYGVHHPEYRKAASALAEVQRQFDDMRRSITNEIEIEYRQSLNREQMLQQAVAETKAEWDHVNANSFQYQQLKQEAAADKALYDELTTKIHEAGINAGFKDNNIRIADLARPSLTPVYPNIRRNLLFALLFSTLLAIGVVMLLDSLDSTLRDPEEASRFLGVDVIGMLPKDPNVSQLPKIPEPETADTAMPGADLGSNGNGKRSRDYYRSISSFEEAVRTVRNTILLSDFERRLRSIVLTSATPEEGKTTLAIYLAIASAAGGKTTLLIDGDLRSPSIHAKFGLNPREGLSNVLNDELAWQDAVLPIDGRPNLSLLPSGPGLHRAADLIGPRLTEFLDEFAKTYDLVILDAPPLLGFAECLQMATAADGVLIISKAGVTRRKDVAAVVSALSRIRANLIGLVLNQVTHITSPDSYAYHGYRKYKDYEKPE